MNGWGWFFLVLVLILLAYGGWCGWRFYSAKKQGLPAPPMKSYIPFMKSGSSNSNYPSPRSGNPLDWIKDQIAKLRNRRTAPGAYEETGGSGHATTGRRGRGLEDDAWDTRVGNEDPYGGGGGGSTAYYNEEQELGLAPTPGYTNEPYGRGSDYLSHNTGYGGAAANQSRGDRLDNPFGDENQAASLRSVSPRPQIETSKGHKRDNASVDSDGSSPTSVRKSVFREGI